MRSLRWSGERRSLVARAPLSAVSQRSQHRAWWGTGGCHEKVALGDDHRRVWDHLEWEVTSGALDQRIDAWSPETDGVLDNETLHGPSSPSRLPGPRGRLEVHSSAAPSAGRGGWKAEITSSGCEEASKSFWRWDSASAISLWTPGTWNTLRSMPWLMTLSTTWINILLSMVIAH